MRSKSRSQTCPFIQKLKFILEDRQSQDLIEWAEDGESINILNISRFSEEILPKYYKHQNFASFIRQLNIYGFFKCSADQNIYKNEKFIKGKEKMMKEIERRSTTSTANQLSRPNEKNQKEEDQELEDFKRSCAVLQNSCKILEEKNRKDLLKNAQIEKEIAILRKRKAQKSAELKALSKEIQNKYQMKDLEKDNELDNCSLFQNARKMTIQEEKFEEIFAERPQMIFSFENEANYEGSDLQEKIDYFSDPDLPLKM